MKEGTKCDEGNARFRDGKANSGIVLLRFVVSSFGTNDEACTVS
jgi:hypothetical protein